MTKQESVARLYCAIFNEELKKIGVDDMSAFLKNNVHITDKDLDRIYRVIGTLTEREQKVLGMRFGYGNEDGQPRDLAQVADVFNVTGERIRQIEKGALRKLRGPDCRGKLPRIFQSEAVEKRVDELFREIRELHKREAALKNALRDLGQLPFSESKTVHKKLSGIDDLDLSDRMSFFLERAGIFTIADLCCLKEGELPRISGLIMKVDGIKKKLAERGLSSSG